MPPVPIHRAPPVGVVVFAVLLVLYLAPTLVAAGRGEPRLGHIARLNSLYGWTFIGWLVAWSMALSLRVSR